MDEELKQLAALHIRNAFYQDFSALVNKYLLVSEGLGVTYQEDMMATSASVFGRNEKADFNGRFDLRVELKDGELIDVDTMHEALNNDDADDDAEWNAGDGHGA